MKSDITGTASIIINAGASRVWEALTRPELIKQYFFGTNAKSDWKPGSPVVFEGEWQGKTYQDKGTVIANEFEKKLSYTYWSSMSGMEDKPENYATVTYDLFEENGKTTLRITQQNIPDMKSKQHSEENWKKVLESLKDLLEKQAV